MVKQYLEKIEESKDQGKMEKLGEMFEDLMYKIKEVDYEMYKQYKTCLYEMAYGCVLSEEMAQEWIYSMKPFGMKWNLEQIKAVIEEQKLSVNTIDFWAIMNAMYNDYNQIFKEEVNTYIELAVDFLEDEDAKPNKTYNYWKYIVTK
jgi:hypothetical protein